MEAFREWVRALQDRAIAELDGRHFEIPDPVKRIERGDPRWNASLDGRDETARAVATGIYTEAEAEDWRQVGVKVIDAVRLGIEPFTEQGKRSGAASRPGTRHGL